MTKLFFLDKFCLIFIFTLIIKASKTHLDKKKFLSFSTQNGTKHKKTPLEAATGRISRKRIMPREKALNKVVDDILLNMGMGIIAMYCTCIKYKRNYYFNRQIQPLVDRAS